jgi:hypothetical protein
MSTVKQTQAIPFTGPISLLASHLRNLAGGFLQNSAHLVENLGTLVNQSTTTD